MQDDMFDYDQDEVVDDDWECPTCGMDVCLMCECCHNRLCGSYVMNCQDEMDLLLEKEEE